MWKSGKAPYEAPKVLLTRNVLGYVVLTRDTAGLWHPVEGLMHRDLARGERAVVEHEQLGLIAKLGVVVDCP